MKNILINNSQLRTMENFCHNLEHTLGLYLLQFILIIPSQIFYEYLGWMNGQSKSTG